MLEPWMNILIVIPTLNPPYNLIEYINNLTAVGFTHILLIDDGSDICFNAIFKSIEKNPTCTIIRHAVNLGKGRALKSAINYYMNLSSSQKYIGIITVDSDGQHAINDVIAVAKQMCSYPNHLILGSRNFSLNTTTYIPWKSLFGNRATTIVFRLLFGKTIHDTQTGLRGIPESCMPDIISLSGERFEYETNILIHAVKHNIDIKEIPIETLYMNDNEETHFRPIKDSFNIYALMISTFIKYTISSISSFLIDLFLFQLFIMLLSNITPELRITLSTVLARTCSSFFNLNINKTMVFKKNNSTGKKYILRYYTLCIIQMLTSAAFVTILHKLLLFYESVLKILVDTILFFFSFRIQQDWVFQDEKKDAVRK